VSADGRGVVPGTVAISIAVLGERFYGLFATGRANELDRAAKPSELQGQFNRLPSGLALQDRDAFGKVVVFAHRS